MRHVGRCTLLGALLAGVVAGCSGEHPAPASGRNLVITGSYAMAPLVKEIARRFEASHPGVRVEVQAVGSARGVSDTQQGLADVGMVARDLRADETANLRAAVLARDGIGLVVPQTNPIAGLTDSQVISLFTRAATNWKQVGGPEGPVTVVSLNEARALAQAFAEHFKLKTGQVRFDIVGSDGEQALKTVAREPFAIGYATVGQVSASALGVRLVPLNGVPATTANVANGTYTFVRPLLLVTRDPPLGMAREFIEFARSPEVRDLIEKAHEVPAVP
jgi:phosphate transport system substrate-binding protein